MATYSQEILSDNPRAYYRMLLDSSVQEDSSGNNIHANSSHGSFISEGPKGNGALAYSGSSSEFLNLHDLDGWRTGPFIEASMEFWVRTTEDRTTRYIFGNDDGWPRLQIEINRSGTLGYWDFQLSDESDNRMRWRFQTNAHDGEWHHIGMSWSNGGGAAALTVVVDGTEVTNKDVVTSGTLSPGADKDQPLVMAGRGTGTLAAPSSSTASEVDLSLVAFYDERLTVSRFQAHYNADDDDDELPDIESEYPLNQGTSVVVPSSNTVLSKPQTPLWFHDGAWWLLSYHSVREGWYVWRWEDDPEPMWHVASEMIDDNPESRFDVFYDKSTGIAYAAQISSTVNRIFELTYD